MQPAIQYCLSVILISGLYRSAFRRHAGAMIICILFSGQIFGQQCPRNIDFENGDFDGWRCYTGFVYNQGGFNVFSLSETPGPVEGRHTIIPSYTAEVDQYGGFPTNSPNGSAYSIRLGNDMGGGEGEAISYEFTIPANRNTYSLLYYYAVVFQDPDHEEYEQPRMQTEITNVTDNSVISCASFTFIPYGTGLPGFFQSDIQVNNTPVWCKDWTPVTINLDGNAGKTIRLTFRTGDCTFRRHFGYAYIDVDTDCSGEFVGASFCPQDPDIKVSAPFGFANYTWFNADMSRQIGTGQILTVSPPPPSGTKLNVKLIPYDGFGCEQTLSTRLIDNLDVRAYAGRDTLSCNLAPVRIGSLPRPGVEYRWSPAAGLSNAMAANPVAIPSISTDYVLTVKSPGGGCFSTDTVKVLASNLGNSLQILGKSEYCIGSNDSAVLLVENTRSIQWYKNKQPIQGANLFRYRVTETGIYAALLRDDFGCAAITPDQPINISDIPKAAFSMNSVNAQCLAGNRFVFTNASTNQIGQMKYRWDFGGTGTDSARDAGYSFPIAGNFRVKMVVRTNSVCADSLDIPVTVFPNPVPDFEAKAICEKMPFRFNNLTAENIGSPIHYNWSIAGNPVSTERNPPERIFPEPGTFEVTLGVTSDQCPAPVQVLKKTLKVEKQIPAKRYPNGFAVNNIPLKLEARKIGMTVRWSPVTFLDSPATYTPFFKGNTDREYTISLRSEGGCETVDTLLVQIIQRADIQVPNAFTPNGDGLNDYLKPVGMGVSTIRYFRVFNRWGQLVYDTHDLKKGWDGTFKGMPQPAQSYVWMVEGVGQDETLIQKKGAAVLIR